MNKLYVFVVLLFVKFAVSGQTVTKKLLDFYNDSDIDCYIEKAKKNVLSEYDSMLVWWCPDYIENCRKLKPPPDIDYEMENVVPMLSIQFIDTQNYNQDDNIYNFISVDSTIIFIFACIDKKMNVKSFVNFFDGMYSIYKLNFKTKEDRMLQKIIKNINKEKPDLILYSRVLPRCRTFIDCNQNGFLFIKNGEIYVYRVIERDIFELNEYIQCFFTLEQIRALNITSIPLIYQQSNEQTRITGCTPKSEIGICPK